MATVIKSVRKTFKRVITKTTAFSPETENYREPISATVLEDSGLAPRMDGISSENA
jgi:hypothetical protein